MVIAGVVAAADSFVRRLQSHPEIYGHCLRVMSGYATKKLDVLTVVSELETLFQSHDDLLTGYRTFLLPQFQVSSPSLRPRQSRKNNVIAADMNKLNPCIVFINKVQKRFADERGVIWTYLETIKAFTHGKLSNNEAYDTVAKIFGDENQDLVDEFESFLGDNRGRKKIKKNKREEEGKFKKEKENNPSPLTFDDLNLYNQMEDEMFELDIHLSHVRTTVQSAKALMKILRYSSENQIINIDKYFSVLSLSCIRKEYKEQGFFIIKKLREDPKHVLPQILSQLESKKEELVESREKLNNRWRETLEQKQNSVSISS